MRDRKPRSSERDARGLPGLREELRRGDPWNGEGMSPLEIAALRGALRSGIDSRANRRRGVFSWRALLAAAPIAALWLFALIGLRGLWRQPQVPAGHAQNHPGASIRASAPSLAQGSLGPAAPPARPRTAAPVSGSARLSRPADSPRGAERNAAGGRARDFRRARGGERPGRQATEGMPSEVSIATAARSAAAAPPAASEQGDASPSLPPRQVQFSTPGGTRVIWLLSPGRGDDDAWNESRAENEPR